MDTLTITEQWNILMMLVRKTELAASNPKNSVLFQEVISDALAAKLYGGPREMGNSLGVSKPTVERWQKGASSPHYIARPSIYESIRKKALDRIAVLEY